jgi:Ser/Thr protein kinase RdoA (MazF antagonist)
MSTSTEGRLGASETAEALLRIARAALTEYDLPPDTIVRPIRSINNAVFEVASATRGVRLILRIHRPGYRTLAHIQAELAFLRACADTLHGTQVEVPRPIATRSGELVVRVGDSDAPSERYCDLLTWIEGRVLKHGRGLGIRSTALLGEGLARLHNAAESFAPPFDLELPRWDAETMFSGASPFRPGPMDAFLAPEAWTLFADVAERTRAVFEELDGAPGQWGIIHNDYVLSNCHFRRSGGGWRLGILDFDDLGRGCFVYDLAPLLGNLSDYPRAYPRLRRAFLDGYRSIRPLPPALEPHLPVLMAARHAATLTWLAAKQRRGETDIPIERHVEIRVSEMARCLALPVL